VTLDPHVPVFDRRGQFGRVEDVREQRHDISFRVGPPAGMRRGPLTLSTKDAGMPPDF
jgi:hypothetical protein